MHLIALMVVCGNRDTLLPGADGCRYHREKTGGEMTRSELIKAFTERSRMSDEEATVFVNAFFDKIRQSLVEGDRVEIRGFGTFAMKNYQPYTGRNPKSGVTVTVGPKRLPVFRAGGKLTALLNPKSESE